jgi:hypothetical protein
MEPYFHLCFYNKADFKNILRFLLVFFNSCPNLFLLFLFHKTVMSLNRSSEAAEES